MAKVDEKFEIIGQWQVVEDLYDEEDYTWQGGFDFGCTESGKMYMLMLVKESDNPNYQSGQYYKPMEQGVPYTCKYDGSGNLESVVCDFNGEILEFNILEILHKDSLKVSVKDWEGNVIFNTLERVPVQPTLDVEEEEEE